MATNPRRESDPNIDTKRLVQQAQGGDNEAFGALYEGLAPPIYRYVLRHVGGNRDVAEDLTSDVFLKVYEKLDTYKERGLPFTAWLYRVTRNHVVDHVRGRPKVGISPLDSVPEVPVSNGITFEQHAELRAELSFALVGLTAEQRTAVELRFLGGLTTAETAKIMGKSEDSVKKLQARGLSNLRAVITSVRDWTEGEEAGKKVKTKEVKHNPSPSSATLESGSNAKEPTGETLERSEDDGADLTCYRLELYTSHLEIDMNRGVGPERPIDSLFNRLIVEAGKRNKPSLDNAGVAFDPENASGIVESASQASRFAEKVLGVQRVKERLINDLTALGFTPDDLDRTLVDVAKSFLEPKVVQPSIVDPEGATAIATPTEQPLEPATPPIQVPEISVLPPVIGPEVVPAQPVVTLGTIEEPQVSVPPAAVVETPTPEKRYIQEDVGPRAAQVLLELYKINETRDNFLHPDLASAVATVYEEALAKLPDNKRIAKVRDLAAELTFNGFRGFATKYRHAQEHTLKIPKNLTSIMTAIAGEPEYGALEVDEVLQIPDRKITFQEVQQKSGIVGPTTFKAQEQIVTPTVTETPVTPISPETGADRGSTSEGPMGETGINVAVAVATAEVEVGPEAPARNPNEISDIEAYILAKGLLEGRGSEVFRQLRLQIGGIDERSIIPIVDAVNESLLPDDLDDRVVWESLYGKLRTFISDPETVLEANRGSDSHALLRLIRPLNSEEDLITFLGSIPVKKNFQRPS